MEIGPSFTGVGDACTAGGLGEAEVAPANPNAHFDVTARTGTDPSGPTGATVAITTLGDLIDVGRCSRRPRSQPSADEPGGW